MSYPIHLALQTFPIVVVCRAGYVAGILKNIIGEALGALERIIYTTITTLDYFSQKYLADAIVGSFMISGGSKFGKAFSPYKLMEGGLIKTCA